MEQQKNWEAKQTQEKKEMARALARIQVPQLDLDVEFLFHCYTLLYHSFGWVFFVRFLAMKKRLCCDCWFLGATYVCVIFCGTNSFVAAHQRVDAANAPRTAFLCRIVVEDWWCALFALFSVFQYLGAFMQNDGFTQTQLIHDDGDDYDDSKKIDVITLRYYVKKILQKYNFLMRKIRS